MRLRLLVSFSLLLLSTPACMAEKRVALVVGNSGYQNVAPLINPRNDATLIADTLRNTGFTLIGNRVQLDLDKAGFDKAIQAFGNALDALLRLT